MYIAWITVYIAIPYKKSRHLISGWVSRLVISCDACLWQYFQPFLFASDALRVEKLNKGPGGAQPIMWEGFIQSKGLLQTMQFPQNYRIRELAGKPKGLKQILKERGLWDRECHARSDGRPWCRPEGRCCARKILAADKIFLDKRVDYRRKLKLVVTKWSFIQSFTVSSIRLKDTGARLSGIPESTDYTLEGLHQTVPQA